MSNYNKLTNGQTERLAILNEEMTEVQLELCKAQQTISKILRHGYKPEGLDYDNRKQLETELGDVLLSVGRLCKAGDLSLDVIINATISKSSKNNYLHHQLGEIENGIRNL